MYNDPTIGTVLAGQDGTSPAINQQTGKQITIEDLLRQRGLMAAGGNMSIYPNVPNESVPATPTMPNAATEASPGVTDPAALMKHLQGGAMSGMVNPNGTPLIPAGGVGSQAVDANSPNAVNDSDGPNMLPYLLAPPAAYAAYRAIKGRKQNSAGIMDTEFGANTGPEPTPGQGANQSSNSAVTRVRTMQNRQTRLPSRNAVAPVGPNTMDGGTLEGRSVPAKPAVALALSARQGNQNLPAVVGQQVPEDEGVRRTIGQSLRKKKPKVTDVLKRVRVR